MITEKSSLASSDKPCAVALGCFDGVHIGHASLIEETKRIAERQNLLSAVYSFDTPPKNFFLPHSVPTITPPKEKQRIIGSMGVDMLIIAPFDNSTAKTSPEDFFEKILLRNLRAKHIVCGFNYRFGEGGKGDVELLKKLCSRDNVGLSVMPPVIIEGKTVSSSEIRNLLSEGNVEKAQKLLGRPYGIRSVVVNGQHLGSSLGFPTVNQLIPNNCDLLRHGVYATEISAEGKRYNAITNVGVRPTVDGSTLCAETNIFDFDGDLYGKEVNVEFRKFIRPEMKFSSVEALTRQVLADIENAKTPLRKEI